MSRLVDIDEVIRIAKDTFPKEDVRKIAWVLCYTPTAYDVEKVIAELEKEKEIHTEHYNISLYKDYPDIKQRYEQIQLVIDNAIAKVRKGGVE